MLPITLLQRHPDSVADGLARRGWSPERIATIMAQIKEANFTTLTQLAQTLPNMPIEDDPIDATLTLAPSTNEGWQRKPHWEIAEALGMVDITQARAIAGPRFTLLRGWGARLERALMQWMLDLHTTQHGYIEIAPPLLATTQALQQTGHLPHFQAEMYTLADSPSPSADGEWG